jgi:foldase protein PrsA
MEQPTGAPCARGATISNWAGCTRLAAVSVLAWAAVCGLVACGGAARNEIVVRVGQSTITKATLNHWMAAMAPEHAVPDPPRYSKCIRREESFTPADKPQLIEECRQRYQALKLQALDFLISSQWLLGEAANRNSSVSPRQVQERVAETQQSLRGSEARSVRDIAFQVRAELAAAAIRRLLIRGEPEIAQALVARRYKHDIARFQIPERRDFKIVEKVVGEMQARKLMGEVVAGKRKLGALSLSESVTRPSSFDVGVAKRQFLTALFAARPHVLVGPLPFLHYYAFFEVTRIRPARVQSLSEVQGAVKNSLRRERQRRTLARFVGEWRHRWIIKTHCARGYVVQKCSQYSGLRRREDPLALQ